MRVWWAVLPVEERLIDQATHRLVRHLRRRSLALRVAAVPVVQMGIAGALSWWIAHDVFGHTSTYFAPVASTIVLSVRPGPRTRRAFEMVLGIAVGIGVGDVIVREIGTGALQIGLIILLAVSAAILLGAGPMIASQAASTAVLVAAIPAPGAAPTRFVDALIGGFVGLGVLAAVPRNPVTPIRRTVEPFLDSTATLYEDAATALEARDAAGASAVLHRATDLGALGDRLDLLLAQGRETARIAPIRWTLLPAVERYTQATPHMESVARGARVLARAVRSACETGAEVPSALPGAIRELAQAVRELGPLLAGSDDDSDLVERALHAAATATASRDGDADLAIGVVVSAVRSAAVDLLRALGVERHEADAHVRAGDGHRPPPA